MSKMAQTDDLFDGFAQIITSELSDKKLYNMAEIKAFLKARMYIVVEELLKKEISKYDAEKQKLIKSLAVESGKKKQEIGLKIAELNASKKPLNLVASNIKEYTEYQQLKFYIEATFGRSAINNFFEEFLNKDERTKRKIHA